VIDWTAIIRDCAPRPERVTAFAVLAIKEDFTSATIAYGELGAISIDYYPHLPGDETTTGDVIWLYPSLGDFERGCDVPSLSGPHATPFEATCITEEERTTVVGTTADGAEIREPFPQLVRLGTLTLDGQRLIGLMQRVNQKLVAVAYE
jgi:hypothetical protein